MYSDWSVKLGADAPTLAVPWQDAAGLLAFVDLRAHPEQVTLLPEAEQHPVLAQALLALNEARSGVTTAKCDVWQLDAEDVASCADLLDLLQTPEHPHFGFGSYIDVFFRQEDIFSSYEEHLEILPAIARAAATLDLPECTMELVLRPCLLGTEHPLAGFSITVYAYGVGTTADAAYRNWGNALANLTSLLLRIA
jgi:hypothetical protein